MNRKEHEWLSPRSLLIVFCCLQLLIYGERGAFASNGINTTIKGEFALTLFQDGLLPAAFMIGLLVSSPIFAEASKHSRPFRLIAYGLAIWAAAVAGCGLSWGFVTLLLCRSAVGVGEASFVALAAPFIDDNAPPESKARWLAIFFLCIPSGFALGFLYGGLVASSLGWRAAFLIEATAVIPFIIMFFRAPPMNLRGAHEAAVAAEREEAVLGHQHGVLVGRLEEAGRDVLQLLQRPFYVWVVAGMTFYTAVISTIAFYGPQAAVAVFKLSPTQIDLSFGAITVITGVLGTLCGGLLLDRWGSSLRNGSLLCVLGLGIGAFFLILGFAFAPSFGLFAVLFSVAECAMFATMAPGNAVMMWAVPPGLRPLAMSMSVMAMHVLGDVPAPPLLGLLQSKLNNWRASICILGSLLIFGSAAYFGGFLAAKTAIDFRTVDGAVTGDREEEEELESAELERGEGGEVGEIQNGRATPEQSLLVNNRNAGSEGSNGGAKLRS